MEELELKFVLNEQTERQLRENPALFRLGGGKASTESFHSIYYDTKDRALKAAGIALRLRRKGRAWLQTVKAGRAIRSGLSSAIEAESRAPDGRLDLDRVPDPEIREEVKRRLAGAEPQPVCETRMRRTRSELALEDGSRIELAIDVGEVRAGDRAAALREAELELISGPPAALFRAARLLFPEGGLEFSTLSKAQRGFLLAEQGRIADAPAPRHARTVPLRRGMRTGDATVAVLRECLDQIAANVLAVGHGEDPEGPHQLRIGLRRLRTVFALFLPAIDGAELVRLRAEAQWLGQAVGRVRDRDVVLGEMVAPAAAAEPGDAGLARLGGALEAAAAAEREALRETLRGPRVQGFLLDLAAFAETGGWLRPEDPAQAAALARPVAQHAAAALDACWRRVRRQARGIAGLSVEDRHELRKRLKRLRYAVEFLGPLHAKKRVKPFLARLKELQTLFGDLNDVAVAEALFAGPDAPGAGDAEAQRAIGRIIGARQARAEQAWTQARSEWRALRETPRFWE